MRFAPFRISLPRRFQAFAALVVGAVFAAPVHAQTNYTGGTGFNIPDNLTGIGTSTITVAGSAQITSFNSITLTNLRHTWVGDVVAFLSHRGQTVQLIGFGEDDSSDFNGTYTLTPTASNTFGAQATAGGSTYVLPGGAYLPYDGSFNPFLGQDVAGAWTLEFYDVASGDTGSLGSWSFNATVNNPTPPPANATYTGAGAAIADADGLTGTPGTTFSDIIVSDTFTIASLSSVTITGLFHDYAGDLSAQLIHVDTGLTVDLFSRLGKTTLDDADLGDDSNFGGNYTFTLNGPSLLAAAQSGNTSYVLPNSTFPGGIGTYAASTSGIASLANPNTLGSFAGQNVGGTWRLRLTDSTAGDAGSFTGWSFGVTAAPAQVNAPEPGALPLALATFPLIGVLVRRRRAL